MGKKLLFLLHLAMLLPLGILGQCPANVGITSSEGNSICQSTPVTFTASIQDNTVYNYEWYRNNTALGIDNYNYGPISDLVNGDQIKVRITDASGTPCSVDSNVITMVVNTNRTPTVTLNVSDNDICIGDTVTFTASNTNGGSAPTYTWYIGSNGTPEQSGSSNTFTTSALDFSNNTVRVVLTSNIACYTSQTAEETSENINIKDNSTISPDTPEDISVCLNESITNIVYTIGGGATGANIDNLPDGIYGSYNSSTKKYTISGTPTETGTFSYTLTTTGPCNQVSANGSIQVSQDASISLTSGSNNQTTCTNTNISSIEYTIEGTGTDANINWSPSDPGLSSGYNAGIFTISGSSSTPGTYDYTVTATGSCGNSPNLSGTIVIQPDATLNLTTGPATQSTCEGDDIQPITYTAGGSVNDISLTWDTDPGLNIINNLSNDGTYTISGSSNLTGTFNYAILANGNCNDSPILNGTITINPNTSVTPTTASDINTCINSAMPTISFDIAGSPNSVSVGVGELPSGLSENYNAATNIFTISGTPSESGIFNYTVTAYGDCVDGTFEGIIDVSPDATIVHSSGSENQTQCEGNNIEEIQYIIGGSGTNATISWTPSDPGLDINNSISSDGTYSLSGNTNSIGTFNYTITATGSCANSSTLSGSITIQPDSQLTPVTSTDQDICIQDNLSNIVFDVSGNPASVSVSGLPDGTSGTYNSSSGRFTISGSPVLSGNFNYTVTADGNCIDDTFTGDITVIPDASLSKVSGSANQTICEGIDIEPIEYIAGGSATDANITWTPGDPGLSIANNISTTGSYIISGSSNAIGTYNYSITSTGECDDSPPLTGTIVIEENANLSLTTANNNQQVCFNSAIEDIQYDFVGDHITVTGLPAGIVHSVNNDQVTIHGSYSTPGTYNYTITASGCGPDVVRNGRIEIYSMPNTPSNGAAPTENQITGPTSVCPTVSGLVYSVTDDPNITSYNWSVPTGFTITSGEGTHSIIVDATSSATDGTVTVTGSNPCTNATSPASINIAAATYAEVMAGEDQTVCAGTPSISLNGDTGGAVSSQHSNWDWSDGTGNTNNFNNERRLNTTYTIPASIRDNGGTITITITSTGSVGSCDPVSDDMILTVLPEPTGSISGSTTICSGENTFLNFSGSANTTIIYNIDGGSNLSIELDAAGSASLDTGSLTSTTTYNLVSIGYTSSPDCSQNISGSAVVTVDEHTVAEAGDPDTICESSTPTPLTLAGASISGGATTGSWSIVAGGGTLSSTAHTSNPDQVSYTPDPNFNGQVTLRLTTDAPGTCPSNFDDRIITIDPAPVVDAGGPNTICQSASPAPIQLNGATISGGATTGSWSIASGGGTLSSTAPTADPESITYTPAADYYGTVTLNLTTDAPGVCDAVVDSRIITIEEAPIANAGSYNSVCQSPTPSAIPLINASLGGGATSGTWSIVSGSGTLSSTAATPNPENESFTPDPNFAGTIELKLTVTGPATCSPVESNTSIIVDLAPTIEAGSDITVCQSANPSAITLSEAVFGGGTSAAAWSISSGTGTLSTTAPTAYPETVTFTPDANNLTDVVLTLTTDAPNSCTAVSDVLTISFQEAPVVDAGNDITICQSESPASLSLNGATISGGATQASWSITSGSGTLSSTEPVADPASIQFTPDVNQTGNVELTLTTDAPSTCSQVIDVRTIIIEPAPTVDAGIDLAACQSSSPSPIILDAANIGGGATTAGWAIVTGSGTLSSTAQTANPETITYTPGVNESGTVTLQLETDNPNTGTCGTAFDTLDIIIHEATIINAGADQLICSNSTASLNASINAGTATQGTWTTSGTGNFDNPNSAAAIYTPSFNDITAGEVRLTYTSINSSSPCNEASDELLLTIKEAVEITTQPVNTGVCSTQSVELTVVAKGDDLNFEWYKVVSGGDQLVGTDMNLTINNASASDQGTYYVRVSGNGACSIVPSDYVSLIVDENIVVNTQPQDQELCVGDTISLSVEADASGGVPTYQWRFNGSNIAGATNATLNIADATTSDSGNYDVVIYGPDGYSCDLGYSETATISIYEPPTADAGEDIIACTTDNFVTIGTDAVISNQSAVQWSTATGTGTFGDANSLSTTYTFGPDEDGTVSLNLTVYGNATCTEVTDNINVQIIALPAIDSFSYPAPLCVSNNSPQNPVLNLQDADISDGSFSYTGSGSLDLDSITGAINPSTSDAGTYDVTFTIPQDGYCAEVSETATIIINALPDPDFSYDATSYCRDTRDPGLNTDPLLTIVTEGEDYDSFSYTGNGTLSLDTNSGTIDLSNSDAGNYTITRTVDYTDAQDDGCTEVSATFNLEIFDKAIPDFTYSSNSYCSDDTDPVPSFSGDSALANFTASPAGLVIDPSTGSIDLDLSVPNNYTIVNTIAASNSCPAVTASFEIIVTKLPVPEFSYANLNEDNALCISNLQATLETFPDTGGTFTSPTLDGYLNSTTGELNWNIDDPVSGEHTITYTIPAIEACQEVSFSQNIRIDLLPLGGELLFAKNNERIFLTCNDPLPGYGSRLNLSGQLGQIVEWEYRPASSNIWTSIDNQNDFLTAEEVEAVVNNETTAFRIKMVNGACNIETYSETALISVIPADIKPQPVQVDIEVICIGTPIQLSSTTGYNIDGGNIEGGLFDNAGIKNNGWSFTNPDGTVNDFDSAANNGRADHWLRMNPHGQNPQANEKVYTANLFPIEDQAEGNGEMVNFDTSVDPAGNKGFGLVTGDNDSYFETPVFSLSELDEAVLTFDQAYNITEGTVIKIEISRNGGGTYEAVPLFQITGTASSGNYEDFGDGTIDERPLNKMEIDLGDYIGYSDLRVRFNYNGTLDGDVWAVDNIQIPQGPQNVVLNWYYDNDTQDPNNELIPIGTANQEIVSYTPEKIGWNDFEVQTKLILDSNGNNCQSIDNFDTIRVFAFDRYTSTVSAETGSCGSTTVLLSASVFAQYQNINITSYPTIDGYYGEWEITGPAGYTISRRDGSEGDAINDPDIIFEAENPADYTFTWKLISNPLDENGDPILDRNGDPIVNPGCPPVETPASVSLTDCTTLDFDGIDDYIELGENLYNSFKYIEAWIRPEASSGTIISGPGWEINMEDLPGTISTNGRWYHIAVTRDRDLYVDGILQKDKLPGGPGGSRTLIGAKWDETNLTTLNHFSGWIEEVRIWDKKPTQSQIRFMMNQRLKLTAAGVLATPLQGEIVPSRWIDPVSSYYTNGTHNLDANGEPFFDLDETNLLGYYRLISMNPDPLNLVSFDPVLQPVDGNTPNHSLIISTPGRLHNIETHQENTSPTPYFSVQDGDWKNPDTWARQVVWDIPNSRSINDSLINWNIARINHNIDSGDIDAGRNPNPQGDEYALTLLGLISEGGLLRMVEPGQTADEKNAGEHLRITHYLELNGDIDLIGESQLIQDQGSILLNSSSGSIERDQQGTRSSYNYNYWTSPVSAAGTDNNSDYSIIEVLWDGSDSQNPRNDINFHGTYHAADHGARTTPITLSTYWMWRFRGTADVYGNWNHVEHTGTMKTGEGYTMKGTSGTADVTQWQNYVFKGKPHNGNFTRLIDPDMNYLLGNPYPSSMDADKFILDNLAAPTGNNSKNIFNGILYFWDHFAGQTHYLEEYIGGYAVYSLAGGIPGASLDPRVNDNSDVGNKIPSRYIPVAQGFFLLTNGDTGENIENYSAQSGPVVFQNSQRIGMRENVSYGEQASVFLSPEYPNKQKSSTSQDSRTKIRLKFNSPMGYDRQILVTLDDRTTDGYDIGFDAPLAENNKEDMYWMINDKKYVIQAVPDFNIQQVLPLGIKINEEIEFTIKIDSVENWPVNKPIYLKDKALDSIHDILKSSYKNNLTQGDYNNRFEIIFNKEEDNTDTAEPAPEEPVVEQPEKEIPVIEGLVEIGYSHFEKKLKIYNYDLLKVNKVMVFDMGGKLIQQFEELPQQKEIDLRMRPVRSGVYIVKTFCDTGMCSKKIIIK